MRIALLCLLLVTPVIVSGQEGNITFRAGYSVPFAPYGIYSDDISSLYNNNDFNFYPRDGYGLTFDTEISTAKKYLSLRFGALYHYADAYDIYEDEQQTSESWLWLTGAAVYGGVSFKAGWENFGFFNTYTAGIFSFDYRYELQYTSSMGGITTGARGGEAAGGAGGKFELGFYGKYKGFGLYPSFQMMFAFNRQSQAVLIKALNLSAGYTF